MVCIDEGRQDHMTTYTIPNGDRTMSFDGDLLAFGTSGTGPRWPLRWLEISIYRTDSGSYVLHTNGRSRVFRPISGEQYSKTADLSAPMTKVSREFLDRWFSEHQYAPAGDPKYGHPIIDDYMGQMVIFEQDRTRCVYSTTAAGLVESAKIEDKDGVLFLTKTAEAALRAASEKDDSIREAFFSERVQ